MRNIYNPLSDYAGNRVNPIIRLRPPTDGYLLTKQQRTGTGVISLPSPKPYSIVYGNSNPIVQIDFIIEGDERE